MIPEERAARSRVFPVNNDREGWVCPSCDPDFYPDPVTHVIQEPDGSGWPVCRFHADEYVHDAIPYGKNCSECGIQHSALWPDGELDLEEED